MAVNRRDIQRAGCRAPDQLGSSNPVVFQCSGERARARDRASRYGIPVNPCRRRYVDFSIPAAAPKRMIKPFNSGPRQPRVLAAHEIDHLSLEPAVIARAVKHCRAGGRIELAIETPQNFAYCVVAVTQIKEITKYLTTPAINGDCVAVNPAV